MCNHAEIRLEYPIYFLPKEQIRERLEGLGTKDLKLQLENSWSKLYQITNIVLKYVYGGSAAQARRELDPVISELDKRFSGFAEKDIIFVN